ncbi:MAG: hypothetical protein HFI96_12340 [Lachnospiraceae bacterium]|jgi:hypothetical protein|nr:hypothetical protein [Lachnospiraceae bacterium]MCI9097312.1 hypothetical protein [Lachnospiraceae bacterium]
MKINYPELVALAKSVTELAIQGNLITTHESSEDTAKEIATFYNTFVDEVTKD